MKVNIVNNTVKLGELIRAERKASSTTLQQTSAQSNIGIRFLSELERGKETAEIGKVITALHAVGLDLAVITNANKYKLASATTHSIKESAASYSTKTNQTLSEQLHLEFPYDWSNPDIESTAFIRLVLAKTRFNDILSIAYHFGIDRINDEIEYFIDTPQYNTLLKLISHIRAGIKIVETNT